MSEYKLVPLPKGIVSAKARELEEFLNKRVKGQRRAIRYIREYFEIFLANLKDPKRPIAVFIFMGPSGVGKTETARALAEYFFGDPDAMTFCSCGNYQHGHEVSTLLGAPPGFVGHNSPPQLCHWNVYQHHVKHLCVTGEYFEIGIEKLSEKIEELGEEIKKIKVRADFFNSQIAELSNSLERLEASLKKCKREHDYDEDSEENQARIENYEELIENHEDAISILRKKLEEENKRLGEFSKKRQRLDSALEEFKDIQAKPPEERFDLATAWFDKNEIFFNLEDKKAILLFDEIEKADFAMHNLLLQITEEGRVTLHSPAGEVTDLRNCVVIMTSNLGGEDIAGSLNENHIGFKPKRRACSKEELERNIYEISLEKLREFFPPEFIGRINKKIVFHPLDRNAMREILEQKVSESNNQNPFKLELDEEVKSLIVDEALKRPENGARLLNDRIVQFVTTEIAPMINESLIKEGDTVVVSLNKKAGKKDLEFALKTLKK